MYQSVLRDPGGTGWIRILPDVCGSHYAVVNGSKLIVPSGTTAFVVVNGILSRPYPPGSYNIFTGVDPFFVRLRNIMTRGDAAVSVSVFFISSGQYKTEKVGTGELLFHENRFNITMKAFGTCSFQYTISNPSMVLQKLVGSYSAAFSEEDLEPCIEHILLSPTRELLSKSIGKLTVSEFNNHLTSISNSILPSLQNDFTKIGLKLIRFKVDAITVPDTEMRRLQELETKYAEGKSLIDLQSYEIKNIWGDVDKRTLAETMTGISSRGLNTTAGTQTGNVNGIGNIGPIVAQMTMIPEIMKHIREQSATMDTSALPPLPSRNVCCPNCHANVPRNTSICPNCGHRF